MKFWKHSLLAATVFMTIASTVTYTSCKHDSCKALMCRNGGTCADEFCRCPIGYEGTQCEIISRNKFLGYYKGNTQVNGLPVTGDAATVEPDHKNVSITSLKVTILSRTPEVISGVIDATGREVIVQDTENRKVTWKMVADNRIEILIEEMKNGEKYITNFQGNK
jgi:hypothetical protein